MRSGRYFEVHSIRCLDLRVEVVALGWCRLCRQATRLEEARLWWWHQSVVADGELVTIEEVKWRRSDEDDFGEE
ncbi:hypothetical protein L1987_46195 [Smallanthus sonchifolius]|uniref:Uncharacterized protein n=1 Tax=Smallanthus sonchifolius TaxID=185202 RepID=A0ACB9FYT2_9ASTR|nr:hypothetical protein L1987_46195 [Smallanthus sonchifolius]